MQPLKQVTSRVVQLIEDDVDTDQIVPARFLAHPERIDLAPALFANRRADHEAEHGEPFVLDDPRYEEARILLAGSNFGCGSSREHAVWALTDAGFRIVIARSFADIFHANALRNGLLPVALPHGAYARLVGQLQDHPEAEVTVDLAEQVIRFPDGSREPFAISAFHRELLLEGADTLDYLLDTLDEIEAHEARKGEPHRSAENARSGRGPRT